MTDGHLTDGHLTDGHLTDEELSSTLDGVADTDLDERVALSLGTHLAGCAPCRQRLAALQAVRELMLMQTPVPRLDPEARSASIAAVLRAAGVADAGEAGAGAGAGGAAATTPGGPARHHDGADVAAAGGHDAPISLPRRRPQVLVGVAAAIVLLGTAIGVPVALSGKSTSASSEASGASGSAARQLHRSSQAQASAAGTLVLPDHLGALVANLGKVDSIGALRSKVAALAPHASAAVPTTQETVAAPTGPNATTATTATTAPTAPTATNGPTAPAGAGSAASTQTGVEGRATASQFEHCLSSAMHAAGPVKSVQSVATVSFRATPALVYVFEPGQSGSSTGGTTRSVVVVTAQVGCRVLGTTHL
jgi:hypothetical protein